MKPVTIKDKNRKRFLNLKKIIKKYKTDELKQYKAFKARAKKYKKVFPDIGKIFLCPTKGGVYISRSTAEQLMLCPSFGIATAYYLLKHPRIAKRIYRLSPFEGDELTKIMFSKECIKLQAKYYFHLSK